LFSVLQLCPLDLQNLVGADPKGTVFTRDSYGLFGLKNGEGNGWISVFMCNKNIFSNKSKIENNKISQLRSRTSF